MNGIDELRSTLDRHAADVVDHDLGGRVGSVHQRVSVVRRRRQAAVAGGAALTLVAVGAVALLPEWGGGEAPVAATVAGVPVPDTMKALGYTYEYDEGVDGDGTAQVDLAASDQPRLVSWATAGGDDRVQITESAQVTTYDVADFSDYVWVGPGEEVSLSVSGGGEVGLAVYELTDAPPAGVTGDGVTFREVIGGERLLDATIGEPGVTEATVSTPAVDAYSYRYFCAHGPKNVTLHVDDGSGDVASPVSCDGGAPFDPGRSTSYTTGNAQGGAVTVRVWLTEGENGPPVASDEVVLGLGVYEPAETTRSSGFSVPTVFEFDGHLWQPSSYETSDLGDRSVEISGDGSSARPVLALGYYSAVGATVVLEHSVTGESARMEGVDGGNALIGLLSQPADTATIRLLGDARDGVKLMIALFERVD
jgi:hypothetical protein